MIMETDMAADMTMAVDTEKVATRMEMAVATAGGIIMDTAPELYMETEMATAADFEPHTPGEDHLPRELMTQKKREILKTVAVTLLFFLAYCITWYYETPVDEEGYRRTAI